MRKNKTLRLHRQHDLDLITLYRASGFSFSKEVRRILIAYVNGEPYEPPEIDYNDVDLSYLPTTIQYHITLNPKDPKEQAVLDMLKDEVKYGYVNAFIKALIRAYIPKIPFIGYGVDNGFITRRITANDIGLAIRNAQRNQENQVAAEGLSVKELMEPKAYGSKAASTEPESKDANSEDIVHLQSDIEVPVPTYVKPQEDVILKEQDDMHRTSESNILQSDDEEKEMESINHIAAADSETEDVEDEDNDDFDDFFAAAQAFTGI